MISETVHRFTEQYKKFEQNGASAFPQWVKEFRESAIAEFTSKGFPTSRDEDWRFTNISPILRTNFSYAANATRSVTEKELQEFKIPGVDQYLVTFLNGVYTPGLSSIAGLPPSVKIQSMKEACISGSELVKNSIGAGAKNFQNAFTSLNSAFLYDGCFVYVPAGIEIDKPIHLLFISTGTHQQQFINIRNLIVIDANAKAKFLSSFRGLDANTNFTNAVTEILAGEKSDVEYIKIQKESAAAYHYENIYSKISKETVFDIFSLSLGALIARNDISGIIDGEAADLNLNGLYISDGEQLVDHHTLMHHIHPNCPSHELFKGILNGNSRAVFNGKVYVNPEAQKTDSKQTNRNLLLSDTATVNAKPELEIFADDVKCTHGAATGGLNQQSVFYLKSRGVSEQTSKGILIVGFAAEVTSKIRDTAIRHLVDVLVVEYLQDHIGITDLPEIVHAP